MQGSNLSCALALQVAVGKSGELSYERNLWRKYCTLGSPCNNKAVAISGEIRATMLLQEK